MEEASTFRIYCVEGGKLLIAAVSFGVFVAWLAILCGI